MSIKAKSALIAGIMLAAISVFSVAVGTAFATYQTVFKNHPADESVYHTFFSATTTSATSTDNGNREERMLDISGAKKVVFYFSRADVGGNTGSSTFQVEVSPDSTNWYDAPRLFGTDTSATATTSVPITGTTTVQFSLDLEFSSYEYARCIVIEGTDGAHTCKAYAEF